MRTERTDLAHCADIEGVAVVIDVLRSFTTAAVALACGAAELILPATLAAAQAMKAADPALFAIGALGGGAPAPGFDVGNSPSQIDGQDLAGRRALLHTAGGTRGVVDCEQAGIVLGASMVCAAATARLLRALAPPLVTFVITGRWTDRDGDEDHACADLIEAMLHGADPAREPYVQRVRSSDFGRRFSTGTEPHLPVADLDCCAAVDRFGFAMRVEPHPLGRVLRAVQMP